MRTLQRYPNVIMRAYLEEAWGMQDIVILYKKAGYYEPVLGQPEPNAATTGKHGSAAGCVLNCVRRRKAPDVVRDVLVLFDGKQTIFQSEDFEGV